MRDYALEHRRRAAISPEEKMARARSVEERNAKLAAAGRICWGSNEKLRKLRTLSFGIPAGVAYDGFNTCPAKGACAGWCYARQGFFVWPHVAWALERNLTIVRAGYERFVAIAVDDLRRRQPRTVRVHDSGDFFEADYLRAWLTIAASLPKIVFYAYTKMHWRFRTMFALGTPANFRAIQSFGGVDDDHIDMEKPHSRVFVNHGDRKAAGYVDATETDAAAIAGDVVKIGLVYHSGGRHLTLSQERALRVFPILNDAPPNEPALEEPPPVNPALPVLFRCDARVLQLTKAKCAEDYYLANGGAVGDAQKEQAAALDKCKRCPIGEKHREELAGATVEGGRFVGDVGVIPTPERAPAAEKALAKERREQERAARERESTKTRPVVVPIRAAQPSVAPRETPKETEMETKKKCEAPGCGKTFVPPRAKSRTCSKQCYQRLFYAENGGSGTNAATPPKAAKVVAPKAKTKPSSSSSATSSTASPLIRYLELLHQVDRLLVEFPEIEDDAKRIRELVGARGE